jgi:hypothetical protein
LFQLTNMPMGTAEIKAYPGLTFTVENPQWHFTAHERDGLYCITMFNLRDNDDLHFSISTTEDFYIVEVKNATLISNKRSKRFSPLHQKK